MNRQTRRRMASIVAEPTHQRAALAADGMVTAGPELGAPGGGDAILRRTGYRTGPWAKYHKRVFFLGVFSRKFRILKWESGGRPSIASLMVPHNLTEIIQRP